MKNIKLRFNYIIWMGLFLIARWKFDLHLLFILISLCVAEESWWVMRMEEGEIERGIWGRIVREQPDKLGVVSLDRISGGLLQACVKTIVWIIEKGQRKKQRDTERIRVGVNRKWVGEYRGPAFPHFPFWIISQFNRSD